MCTLLESCVSIMCCVLVLSDEGKLDQEDRVGGEGEGHNMFASRDRFISLQPTHG
jgi:hypothetical protein